MKMPPRIPDIQTLLVSPERIADLPAEEVPPLLAQLLGIFTALISRLLVAPLQQNNRNLTALLNDRLLTAEEAAPILGVSPRWLYRHADKLPYTRRLSPKVLRFSEAGIHHHIAPKELARK